MPAARYWRIIGVETYGGGDLELSELALYEGATRVDGSATLTCTATPIVGTLANLQDADTGTTTRFAGADVFLPGFALVWDFGVAQSVDAIRLTPVAVATGLTEIALQFSSDAVAWEMYYKVLKTRVPTPGVEQAYSYANHWADQHLAISVNYNEAAGTAVTGVFNHTTVSAPVSLAGPAYAIGAGGKFGNALKCTRTLGQSTILEYKTSRNLLTSDRWTVRGFMNISEHGLSGSAAGTYFVSSWVYVDQYLERYFGLVFSAVDNKIGIMQWNSGGLTQGSATITLGQTHHLAFTRDGSTVKAYLDGVLAVTTTYGIPSHANDGVSGVRIGTYSGPYGFSFTGFIDDFEYFDGAVLYNADFTPPTVSEVPTFAFDRPPLRQANAATPTTISEYPAPAFTIADGNPTTFDMGDGGTATIYGTVKRDADPDDLPVARRVRLYDERGRRFIRETWSDANGDFSFTGINQGGLYTAIAYDHLGQFRAVISDALVAEA